jgi:hypothetical protein
MVVSGQIHAPAPLIPVPFELEAVYIDDMAFCRTDKFSAGDRASNRPVRILLVIPTTLTVLHKR